MPKARNVEEYFSSVPIAGKALLAELREVAKTCAPSASEELRWGYPAYLHPSGVILFMLSAHKAHASAAFTPSTRDAFAEQLTGFETGKGTVKLPYDQPPPTALLKAMIEHRVIEFERDGMKWM
jgi:uncharacterized protein YdhG (YjbR/CyaY superfamily)